MECVKILYFLSSGLTYFHQIPVVYLSIPTSNHNPAWWRTRYRLVVYLSIPTSNHNLCECHACTWMVVYLSIPTSNHNDSDVPVSATELYICLFLHQTTTIGIVDTRRITLYICLFLHQTTTVNSSSLSLSCCISVYSYIKPQLPALYRRLGCRCISVYSYIKPQQNWCEVSCGDGCISVYSYIKPQPGLKVSVTKSGCISVYSYIKPQLYGRSPVLITVVYLSIPTSNHNSVEPAAIHTVLYICLFLHQTTTWQMP